MRKLSVGLIATALLLSGALVGVSYGGEGGITEPEVIELSTAVCGTPGWCRHFPMVDWDGRQTGQVSIIRNPIYDADGKKVGTVNVWCSVGLGTDWVCTYVHTLKAGAYTAVGTIVTTGIYTGNDGDVFAVTGGTGAYDNVRGHATMNYSGELNYTLNLIP